VVIRPAERIRHVTDSIGWLVVMHISIDIDQQQKSDSA
jgi:hypothetical protein